MRGPLRKKEVLFLRAMLLVSVLATAGQIGLYFHLDRPAPIPEYQFDPTGKTAEQVALAGTEYAQAVAFAAIQGVTRNALRDRAFRDAMSAMMLASIAGYLLWRLRGIKAV